MVPGQVGLIDPGSTEKIRRIHVGAGQFPLEEQSFYTPVRSPLLYSADKLRSRIVPEDPADRHQQGLEHVGVEEEIRSEKQIDATLETEGLQGE